MLCMCFQIITGSRNMPLSFYVQYGISLLVSLALNARAARVLLLLVVPGHLIFTYSIYYMSDGHIPISILFLIFYLTAAVVQVCM